MDFLAIDVARTPFDSEFRTVGVSRSELAVRSVSSRRPKVAVASWRWDFDGGRSRNLASLLEFSISQGIEYLFVDVVSVDQSLRSSRLIEEVLRFAQLYDSLPVIAAYDPAPTDRWPKDLTATYRPWIRWEMRRVARSSAPVMRITRRPAGYERQSFTWALEAALRESYARCVLRVAAGVVGMTDPSDFIRILAPISTLVEELDSILPRNDFLLAIALILGGFERRTVATRFGDEIEVGFHAMDISSYFDVTLERFTSSGHRWHEPVPYRLTQRIELDGRCVATIRSKMTTSWDREHFHVEPDALDTLAAQLDLSTESRALLTNAEAVLGDLLPNDEQVRGATETYEWNAVTEEWNESL